MFSFIRPVINQSRPIQFIISHPKRQALPTFNLFLQCKSYSASSLQFGITLIEDSRLKVRNTNATCSIRIKRDTRFTSLRVRALFSWRLLQWCIVEGYTLKFRLPVLAVENNPFVAVSPKSSSYKLIAPPIILLQN